LDGETDWKLRKAISYTQKTSPAEGIFHLDGHVVATPPSEFIYNFAGYLEFGHEQKEPLSLENTLWADTVLAS